MESNISLSKFNREDLEEYYNFLDRVIEKFDLKENDIRLYFNIREDSIVFTIGNRCIFNVYRAYTVGEKFEVISTDSLGTNEKRYKFSQNPIAYLNRINSRKEIESNLDSIFEAIEKELARTKTSKHKGKDKAELRKMAFDISYRKEKLSQLPNESNPAPEQMETHEKENKTIPLNQILFGAPGTGKTYNTKRIAVEIINGSKERTRDEINAEYEDLVNAKQIVFTTFHQSLSYEDFIEGIKPVVDENEEGVKNIVYEVKDGILKEICIRANTNKLEKSANNFDEVWDRLIETVKNEITQNKLLKIGAWEYGLSSKDSLKYSSINSPSQYTFTITKQNILDTYQNRQARPSGAFQRDMRVIVEYLKNNFNLIDYKEEEVLPQSNIPYVLIIDEINRGNVSAIFGELITLLEEDKRKGNKEHTEVILPYSNDKFSVPNNVYIIGTMNTADRSVEALDTALRRRFSFVEMLPQPELLESHKIIYGALWQWENESWDSRVWSDTEKGLDHLFGFRDKWDSSKESIWETFAAEGYNIDRSTDLIPFITNKLDLAKLLSTINRRIEVLIDKDHQIGHSYFIGIQNLEDLKRTFRDKIIPLLEEYFYGDFGKIGLVLGGSFIYQEENTAKFSKNFTYENDFLEERKVYRFTTSENWDVQTFISVYED